MQKYLNQVHSFQKLVPSLQNVLTWLDGQILMTMLCSSILPKIQECEIAGPCLYMVFSRQSSIVTCQNLEGCVAFPRKPPKGMHRRCFRHHVLMLWHNCRTWFWDYLNWGLCVWWSWWCAYSARIAQALAGNKPTRSPQTSGDRIWGNIARK